MEIKEAIDILTEFKKNGYHMLMIKYNWDRITTNKKIETAIDLILEGYNEWFNIADDILRATEKYGEISIGEVSYYISKLQKEKEEYRIGWCNEGEKCEKLLDKLNKLNRSKYI